MPAVGFMRPKADLDRGRLARAVGPEQTEHLVVVHDEIDPLRISTLRRRKPTATVLRRPLTSTADSLRDSAVEPGLTV